MKDPKRFRLDFPEFYLKTGDQIHDVFTQLGFNPGIVDKAFANTVEIASKCEIDLSTPQRDGKPGDGKPTLSYPNFTLPEGKTSNYDYFIELIKKGWQTCNIPNTDEYRDRLKMEVDVFKKTGFIDYMLIVQDYVGWAQSQGIMLGMARGSASGSLVAYLLRIIDVDPVKHGLNFYRFMNPERVSPPDIDVDIQASRREEVKQYITNKYEGKVVNIGTYPALRSKGVVRDACRVLEVPLNIQTEILDAIPVENDHEDASKQIKLKDAYKEYPEFKAVADKYPRLFKIIFRLEGLKKAEGVHASGVVISPGDITELVPLRINKEVLSTQFDAEDIEKLGLLKVDLLGLKMLDTAVETLKLLDPEDNVVWSKIPEDDPKTWGLICSGVTKGIFQLENPQMRKLLLDIHPRNIRDLATILALFRPGPARAGLVQEYTASRLNPHTINFGHPGVKKVLGSTFNVMIFQEDLMQLTKELAGFTDGEADNFRRMVGKQKPD
ncbi:MAG TPA: hypothetical protein VNX68_07820, partial [Nitrosopumilaceae archaeon]|nr:hypothetical protein [Nitrosopumilaceae archaeon]